MRRWIIGWTIAALIGASGYAAAQIVPALPFQLQNNTLADATQVMANFNQLLNSVNTNGAKNGANSDITALLGLTTPLAPAVGGTSTWTGGTSTGAANAQVIASVVPNTFALTNGSRVLFKAGFTNTAKLQINVSSAGLKDVYRKTQVGPSPTAGGEVIVGDMVEVIYDGTQFQLVGPVTTVGTLAHYVGSTAPPGWFFTSGFCVNQADYPALFTVAGLGWGACGAGQFAILDTRGEALYTKDDLGGVAANRLTVGGSGCAGTTLNTACGAQNQVIAQANLPNVNFTLAISDTRTWATGPVLPGGGVTAPGAGGITGAATSNVAVTVTGGTIGGTAASGGSDTALTTVAPGRIVTTIIKY